MAEQAAYFIRYSADKTLRKADLKSFITTDYLSKRQRPSDSMFMNCP